MDKRKGQQTWNHHDDATAPYMPSPAEIAAATAKIRESWDDAEHHRRAGLEVPGVGIQQHSCRDLAVV